MVTVPAYQVEEYLNRKGLSFRRRGQKAELRECPFCFGGEHKDRFNCVVYLDGGNYTCMRGSCDQRGSFWQFVEHFGDDPKEFFPRDLSEQKAKPHPLKKPIEFKPAPKVEPKKITDQAMAYLKARGFTEELIDDVSIWCDESGCVNFGYYHKSELCLVKVRQPRKPQPKEMKTWQAWKGGLRTLWGLDDVPDDGLIVITFGEYDRMALRQAGVLHAVSVPCGDMDLEWIDICFDRLARCREIILWPDNDESGKKVVPKIAERLGKEKISVVECEFKDANEMLLMRTRAVGLETACNEIFAAVSASKYLWTGALIQFSDIEQPERNFDGYKSGFKVIDDLLGGFLFHRLTVHTGDSKAGKSSALLTVVSAAVEQGAVACIWTGEDTAEDYKYNLQVHLAGEAGIEKRTSQRTGRIYASVIDDYKRRIDEWLRDKLFVLNVRVGVTEDLIMENFELAHKRYGCDTFVIDNLMKVVSAKATEHPFQRQASIMNNFSNFVKDNRAHGHMVAHQKKSTTIDKDSVSGAKEITNIADSVVSWQRISADQIADPYTDANSVCAVLANRVFGDEGEAKMRYDPVLKRFHETTAAYWKIYPI